ncbi:hypothetical protein J7K70_02940 [bacterium]|nr:hypothetical protein [bacterium]
MTPSLYFYQWLSSNPVFLYILIAWSLLWKGLALWKSARQGQKWWFIVLLIINTLGLLEILYIFVFSRENRPSVKEKKGTEEKEELLEKKDGEKSSENQFDNSSS